MKTPLSLSLIVSTLAVACAWPPSSEDDTASIPNVDLSDSNDSVVDFEDDGDPNEVFTQTVVLVRDDGSIATSSSTITRAEQWKLRRQAQGSSETVKFDDRVHTREGWTIPTGCTPSSALSIWDQPNYVGNTLCMAYQALAPIYLPGLDFGTISRGAPTSCGYHMWWEVPRTCVYNPVVGAWHWESSPFATNTLHIGSLKNLSGKAGRLSNNSSACNTSGTLISVGQQSSSIGPFALRYIKAVGAPPCP